MKGNPSKQKKNKKSATRSGSVEASQGSKTSKASKAAQKEAKKPSSKNPSSSTSSPPSSSSSSSSSLHTGIGYTYYVLAILSLIAGICTPPLHKSIITNYYFSNTDSYNKAKMNMKSSTMTNVAKSKKEEMEEVSPSSSSSSFIECNTENLSQFLHDEPIVGMHIFCFPPLEGTLSNDNQDHYYDDDDDDDDDDDGIDEEIMTVYKYASNNGNRLYHPISKSFTEFKQFVTNDVDVEIYNKESSTTPPWAIYSINGEKLVNELDHDIDTDPKNNNKNPIDILRSHGMVILFEGGSWLWPGVRIGFQRSIEIDDMVTKRNITIETLSLFPLVLSVQDFITEKECTHIQKKANPHMEYSEVSLMDKDKGRPSSDFRTSQSTFLDSYKDKMMAGLEHRTASLTRIPRNHQELTQVLRYGEEEKYSAHLDWFDRELYQKDPHTLKLIDNGKRNRLSTVFWYLSDVEAGGHTAFPRFNKAPQPWNFDDCTKGLLVKPQRGKVIVFYSLTADGKGDELSLHGACKVEEGIKWAANKWVWNAPMHYVS